MLFIGEQDSFKLYDIELGFHSHRGTNGARGSAVGFSKLGYKTVIDMLIPHVLSMAVIGRYKFTIKLDYNQGPSSWQHADCLIHKNGRRQMIFIIKGKYCR